MPSNCSRRKANCRIPASPRGTNPSWVACALRTATRHPPMPAADNAAPVHAVVFRKFRRETSRSIPRGMRLSTSLIYTFLPRFSAPRTGLLPIPSTEHYGTIRVVDHRYQVVYGYGNWLVGVFIFGLCAVLSRAVVWGLR